MPARIFPGALNGGHKSHHYPLPGPEKDSAQIGGVGYSRTSNLRDAYLHSEMDDECAKITYVELTSRNVYIHRLAFRKKKCRPAIFQRAMDTMFSGRDFAVAYLDNTLVKSGKKEEDKKNVFEVLRKIQD